MTDKSYLLDNAEPQAGIRFQSLSQLFDASTFRHIEQMGIKKSWHCWEVGAGGSTVVQWLSEQVGPDGFVLATDIDHSWAQKASELSNTEIRIHDIATETAPRQQFDLIHCRLVLIHLENRNYALQSMISALKPGGWILIEDADPLLQPLACPDVQEPDHELANKVRIAVRSLLFDRGADLQFGRRLPRLLRESGLKDVQADAYFPVAIPASVALEEATINQLSDKLIASGYVSKEETERHLSNIKRGVLDFTTAPLISAWGHSGWTAQ